MTGAARRLAVAIVAASLFLMPPALGAQEVLVHNDAAVPIASIELWYRAPADGYDGKTPGISRLAVTAVAASALPHSTSLAELVDGLGGTLTISAYPDIVMVGASVPAADSKSVLAAMKAAYGTPQISHAAIRLAAQDAAISAAEEPFDSARTLQDLLYAQLFASGPAHDPPTPPVAQLNTISGAAIRAFAARAFRPGNAIFSVAGNVGSAQALLPSPSANAASLDPPFDSVRNPSPGDSVEHAQSTGIGFAWTGPPISDERSATALDFIADYLFDSEHGTVARALESSYGSLFINGQFITLHDPGVMIVTVSGSTDPSIQTKILEAVKKMRSPMSASAFSAARAAFEYHILSQAQTAAEMADNFGWYAAEGNPSYAPGARSGAYLKTAQSLNPAFVAQTASRYLRQPAIVRLLQAPAAGGVAL